MTKRAVGLDLDPVQPIAWRGAAGNNGLGSSLADFPPAYVVSPLPGGQLVLEHRWPGGYIGSGLEDLDDPSSRRIPLAYALELLLAAPESRLDYVSSGGKQRGPNTADALGYAAVQLLAQAEEGGERSIALAVPNAIQESEQDALLRGMRRGIHDGGRARDSVALVWRPIAAALQWIERFGPALPNGDGLDRESIGKVLHLHLGFEAWEATSLEIVHYQHEGQPWLLPGRRMPLSEDLLLQAPLAHLEAIAKATLPALVQTPEPARSRMAWHAYWMSSLLRQVGASGEGSQSTQHLPWLSRNCPQLLRQEFLRRIDADPPRQPRWFSALHAHATADSTNVRRWRASIERRGGADLLGMVVSGPLAAMPTTGGSTLAIDFAAKLGLNDDRVLIDSIPGCSVVAKGAFTFAQRRLNGQPTYLDTLPEVSTIVNIRGEPTWRNLLADEQEWVLGDKTWQGEPKDIRFQIDRGYPGLDLVVHRKGAPTCRKVTTQFDALTLADCPVSLQIEMEPGQGNPRVEVVPDDPKLLRGRRLQLDWSLATDTRRSREEELEAVPRAFPPLEPRAANRWLWRDRNFLALNIFQGGLRVVVGDYLATPNRWQRDTRVPRNLKSLKRWFWFRNKPRAGESGTAVSSDGQVDPGEDKDLLDRFVLRLVDRIRVSDQDTQRDLLRVLGSTSTRSEEALSLLREQIHSAHGVPTAQDRRAILYACGNCFRDADDLELLFRHWEARVAPDYVDADSLALPLLYREAALESVESPRIERWMEKLRRMLGTRPVGTRVQLPVSRSALAIAYLLRRRAFDNSFLVPGTDLHEGLKAAVLRVKRDVTATDTPAVIRAIADLQRIADYLDRRGSGRLTGILADEEDHDLVGEE